MEDQEHDGGKGKYLRGTKEPPSFLLHLFPGCTSPSIFEGQHTPARKVDKEGNPGASPSPSPCKTSPRRAKVEDQELEGKSFEALKRKEL